MSCWLSCFWSALNIMYLHWFFVEFLFVKCIHLYYWIPVKFGLVFILPLFVCFYMFLSQAYYYYYFLEWFNFPQNSLLLMILLGYSLFWEEFSWMFESLFHWWQELPANWHLVHMVALSCTLFYCHISKLLSLFSPEMLGLPLDTLLKCWTFFF